MSKVIIPLIAVAALISAAARPAGKGAARQGAAGQGAAGPAEPAGDQRPPNTLRPDAVGRAVVSHQHDVVRACEAHLRPGASPPLTCTPVLASGDVATKVRFVPIIAGGVARKDARKPVTATIPSGSDEPLAVDLSTGEWQVHWKGVAPSSAFRVTKGGEQPVVLKTRSGACRPEKVACLLRPTVTRTISLPTAVPR